MPEGMQAAPGHPAWWRRSLRARGTRSALVRGCSTSAASAALRRHHPQRGRAESFAGCAVTEPGPPGLHAQRQTVPMSHSTHAVRSNPTDPLPSPGGHVAIPRGTLPRAPTLGLVGLTRNPGHAAYAQVPPVVGHTGNTLAWLPRLRRARRPQARTPPAGPAPRTLGTAPAPTHGLLAQRQPIQMSHGAGSALKIPRDWMRLPGGACGGTAGPPQGRRPCWGWGNWSENLDAQ